MNEIMIKGLITGTGLLIISFAFNFITSAVFPGLQAEYADTGIFRPWSDPLMQLYFAYPFIVGLILAYAWGKIKNHFKDETAFGRGFQFGIFYFVLAAIPGMFITYSSFQLSEAMVLSWTLSGLIQAIAAGVILANLDK